MNSKSNQNGKEQTKGNEMEAQTETTETTTSTQHPFELSGLGVAPFKYLGTEIKEGPINLGNGLTVGAPGQPMGTCQHCGQGIKYCCKISDANGKISIVGSDCVMKLLSPKNALYKRVKNDRAEMQRAKAKARLEERKVNAVALASEFVKELAVFPHSNKYLADKGNTLVDEINYMIKCAGNQKIVSTVNRALKLADINEKA